MGSFQGVSLMIREDSHVCNTCTSTCMIHVIRFVSDLVGTQKTGLPMTRRISSRFVQRFFTMTKAKCNRYHICRDIVTLQNCKNVVMWYFFRCFEAQKRYKSTSTRLPSAPFFPIFSYISQASYIFLYFEQISYIFLYF